jgi:hypothetical protein
MADQGRRQKYIRILISRQTQNKPAKMNIDRRKNSGTIQKRPDVL